MSKTESNGDIASIPPGVTLTTLDSGLTIIVREDHSAPVVSAQSWAMAGSIHEGKWLGAGFLGFVQSPIFNPALCIVDDSRYDEALALLNIGSERSQGDDAEWRCPKCSEIVPGNFENCWSCSGKKPEKA